MNESNSVNFQSNFKDVKMQLLSFRLTSFNFFEYLRIQHVAVPPPQENKKATKVKY